MESLVSVIVPFYNSELYISQCVQSILEQSYKDLEIILINDGSVDNSLDICKSISLQDKRVKIICKKNEGVSSARNKGIENSNGEYITFVDSDDTIDNKMIEEMVHFAKKHDSDLVTCGYKIIKPKQKVKLLNSFRENLYSNDKKEVGYLLNNKVNLSYAVGKLYKKEVFVEKNISFNKKYSLGEDAMFVYDYILNINSIAILKAPYYNYKFQNNESLSTRYNSNIKEIYSILYEKKQLFSFNFFGEQLKYSKDAFLAPRVIYNNYKKGSPFSRTERKLIIRKYMNQSSLKQELTILKNSGIQNKIFVFLLKFNSPALMDAVYYLRVLKVKVLNSLN